MALPEDRTLLFGATDDVVQFSAPEVSSGPAVISAAEITANDSHAGGLSFELESVSGANNGTVELRADVSDDLWDAWLQTGQSTVSEFDNWFGNNYFDYGAYSSCLSGNG